LTPKDIVHDEFVQRDFANGNHEAFLRNAWSDVLTHAPIVKGDFKTPNPWGYFVETRYYQKGTATVWLGDSPFWVDTGPIANGNTDDAQVPEPDTDPNLFNKALDRLYEQVRGGLDLAQDIIEMGQTRKMIRDVHHVEYGVSSLFNYVGNLPGFRGKRLVGKLLVDFSKTFANKFLEVHFGWQPLINDIFGCADESVRMVRNKITKRNFSGSASLNFPKERSVKVKLNGETQTVIAHYSGKQFVRFHCSFMTDDNNLARWTSLNPLSIAYQVAPLSFVVDYFYNVGGYLRNLETSLLYGPLFRGGYMDTGTFWVGGYTIPNAGTIASGQTYSNVNCSRIVKRFSRGVLNSPPMPNLPRIEANLGSTHLLVCAALLTQFIAPVGKVFNGVPTNPRTPFKWPDFPAHSKLFG